jgi:hypothetical protein
MKYRQRPEIKKEDEAKIMTVIKNLQIDTAY